MRHFRLRQGTKFPKSHYKSRVNRIYANWRHLQLDNTQQLVYNGHLSELKVPEF